MKFEFRRQSFEVSRKTIPWQSCCSTRSEGQTDWQDWAISRRRIKTIKFQPDQTLYNTKKKLPRKFLWSLIAKFLSCRKNPQYKNIIKPKKLTLSVGKQKTKPRSVGGFLDADGSFHDVTSIITNRVHRGSCASAWLVSPTRSRAHQDNRSSALTRPCWLRWRTPSCGPSGNCLLVISPVHSCSGGDDVFIVPWSWPLRNKRPSFSVSLSALQNKTYKLDVQELSTLRSLGLCDLTKMTVGCI
jgi:hypothetical protein